MAEQVELDTARYAVLMDDVADSFVRGFSNLEDAQEELKRTSFSGDHYLVEILDSRTVKANG